MYPLTSLLVLAVAPPLTIIVSGLALFEALVIGSPVERLLRYPRWWGRVICTLARVRVEIQGLEHLDPDVDFVYIFAANHASQFDIFAFQGYFPRPFRWIAKKELFRIPVFGRAMRRAGFISIDRSRGRAAMRSMLEAARLIREGASVLIFPEGTRSPDGRLGEFKAGAAMLAIKAGVPVVPVAFIGSRDVLPKGRLLARPGRIVIRIGRPLPTRGLDRDAKREFTARLRAEVARLLEGEGRTGTAASGRSGPPADSGS